MAKTTKQFSIAMPDEYWEGMRKLASKEERSIAAIARKAIREYLKRQRVSVA